MLSRLTLLLFSLDVTFSKESIISFDLTKITTTSNSESFKHRRLANYTYTDTLDNIYNYQYITSVYVGSKQQKLNLIIDTGSSEMWFAGPNCPAPS